MRPLLAISSLAQPPLAVRGVCLAANRPMAAHLPFGWSIFSLITFSS